jgi:4-hydroxy-2-oxoheptanedioate aldolase
MKRSFRDRIRDGETVCGPWCVLPSPAVIDIIGKSGADFVILDMEHGAHDLQTIEGMLRAAECTGCSALVRVPGNDEAAILHVLDLGAEGVIVPHIQSAGDAAKAIASAKYHPLGSRGFSPYTRAGGYSLHNVAGHTAVQNERTVLCLILEGKEGIENLDEILALPGISGSVDIIYIGAYDLSQALGMPGQVDHPEVRKHLEQSIGKITRAGIAAGGYVAKTAEDMQWMMAMGMQFITLLPDVTIIYHAFESQVNDFAAEKKKAGGKRP